MTAKLADSQDEPGADAGIGRPIDDPVIISVETEALDWNAGPRVDRIAQALIARYRSSLS